MRLERQHGKEHLIFDPLANPVTFPLAAHHVPLVWILFPHEWSGILSLDTVCINFICKIGNSYSHVFIVFLISFDTFVT